jgi:hypothetical protein
MRKIFLLALATIVSLGFSGVAATAATPEPDVQLVVQANEPPSEAIELVSQGQVEDALISIAQVVKLDSGNAVLNTNANAEQDNVAAVLATSESVAIGWDFSQNDSPVSVVLNGVQIAMGDSSGSISAENIQLAGVAELSFTQESTLSTTSSDIPAGQTQFSTVAIEIAQPATLSLSSALNTATALATSQSSATVLRYQTFIPFDSAPVPTAGCSMSLYYAVPTVIPRYLGNLRDFQMPSSNNKTALQLNVDWVNKTVPQPNVSIGETVGYVVSLINNAKTVVYRDTAQPNNVYSTNGTFYSNSVYVHIHHDVANPDCLLALGIYYDISGQVYRTGGYSLTGTFRNVPNHEFAYKDSINPIWKNIYKVSISSPQSFLCFTPGSLASSCMTSDGWYDSASRWYPF